MRKLFILWSILFCSLFLIKMVIACDSIDSRFTLFIGDLKMDTNKLEAMCAPEKCTIDSDSITIRSHYDSRVGVIIFKARSANGIEAVKIKLPYDLKEKGMPVESEIVPEKYNWSGSVAKDLGFLKARGILEMADSAIREVSNLAANRRKILDCQDGWKALASNCDCDKCVKCGGAMPVTISLPKDLLE